MRETLASLAICEPLSGLYNRRCPEGSLEREVRRTARNGMPIAVIMLEVDNLKRFNDTFGHGIGDTMLNSMAKRPSSRTHAGGKALPFGSAFAPDRQRGKDGMRYRLWLIVLLLLFLIGCQSMQPLPSPQPSAPQPVLFNRAAEELAVYAVILQNAPDEIKPQNRYIVVSPTIDTPGTGMESTSLSAFLREKLPTLDAATWLDLRTLNGQAIDFPADVEVGIHYRVIAAKELDRFAENNSNDFWAQFGQYYQARAFGRYSRVGFNDDGTQALLYSSITCGELCGESKFVLLEKTGREWRVVGEVITSNS